VGASADVTKDSKSNVMVLLMVLGVSLRIQRGLANFYRYRTAPAMSINDLTVITSGHIIVPYVMPFNRQ
jgi:hypothetical protein